MCFNSKSVTPPLFIYSLKLYFAVISFMLSPVQVLDQRNAKSRICNFGSIQQNDIFIVPRNNFKGHQEFSHSRGKVE